MNTELRSAISHDLLNGRNITSVIADFEPASQRRRAVADLAAAIPCPDEFNERVGTIDKVVTTPDFHPGKPVPVGVVVDTSGVVMPHLIGNDIGCGMQLIALPDVEIDDLGPGLEAVLRHVHFQGGRGIALNGRQRHAILRDGLPGLASTLRAHGEGLTARLSEECVWRDIDRMCDDGGFATSSIDALFEEYGRLDGGVRYDAILGTIGGGNHFVELGFVEKVVDGAYAKACGLKTGMVVLVVHSGSLDFGQAVGSYARQSLQAVRTPGLDARILSQQFQPELYSRYLNGMKNAANVAFVNRYLIASATVSALSEASGKQVNPRLVYDAPHNLAWEREGSVRHRKGACPARGVDALVGPYQWLGEPVILPGSMGDGTWLLRGKGLGVTAESSAHGAGRKLARQEARRLGVIPSSLRVVGPVDFNSPSLRSRADVMQEAQGRLAEEAPSAYRSIDDVVSPMVQAGMVGAVAKVKPILTVKG